MEPQEIFNHVVPRLLKQNKRAVDEYGSCLLIAPDGSRCAYGMLLPEDWSYDTLYEDDHIPDDYFEEIGVKWSNKAGTIQARLLEIHNNHSVDEWPVLFQAAAKEFKLEYGQWNES